MIDFTSFKSNIRELIRAELAREPLSRVAPFVRLGTISPDYVSGRPKVIFDGESVATGRTYPYLASYTPAANDRVLLLKAGNTWVVVGKII